MRHKLIATKPRRRALAIRHVSGHRLVAILEIVSPANKDRRDHVRELADKILDAVRHGVHVWLVDLFPPGRHDPHGIPWRVWRHLGKRYRPPADEPLTLASCVAGRVPELYLEFTAVGRSLPEMPLFLDPERYVNIPLEAAYQAGDCGVPRYWREVLEAPQPAQ